MFTKKSVLCMFFVLLAVLMMSNIASAHPLKAVLGTGFTYQGKLTDGGAPANGTYDFEFRLYDDLSAGNQVGSTAILGDVTVTAGLFTVQLDFGDVFDGTALYLNIGVRPGSETGEYTALTPRQQLTATPYASYASKAPWSGLTNVPTGFADGVDNGSSYQNVKVVAKSGGDFTTITDALNSITDAGDTNRYLVRVAPGVYEERVTMKEYVDIEGAGEMITRITFTGSTELNTGTVVGANSAELRFLTASNTGGNSSTWAIAVYNSGTTPRLTHVTTVATGGTTFNVGVYNSSSSPRMTNVTARAWGTPVVTLTNIAVYNNLSSSPAMTDVTANAWNGTTNRGVNNDSSSLPAMTNVTASAWGPTGSGNYGVSNGLSSPTMTNVTASASGGTTNYGVANYESSSPTMTNVTASASGGYYNDGVHNDSSSPTMTNVTARASGGIYRTCGVFNQAASSPTINNSVISASGGTNNYGICNNISNASGTYTVLVNNSQISATTNTIYSSIRFMIRIGASQLNGGAVYIDGGTVTCAGVYDENYTFFASTCP